MTTPSPLRRREILDALRRGTVPQHGLDALAVGLDRFERALDEELATVRLGGAAFKAVRGEYGAGKTFFSRWLEDRARGLGFATSEVQISETETPLHRIETVYRRLLEGLATASVPHAAWRSVVDGWFFQLEEAVLAEGEIDEANTEELVLRTNERMERRLGEINRRAPAFSAALRGYRNAMAAGEHAIAEGLLGWLAGQPNVAASVKRWAAVKGDVDHFGALSFLQGLLAILRDSGYPGLVLVLDELETLQRVRSDVREKGLNALRQLIDEVDGGRFPGLYVLITGTPAFFEGPMGVQRLPPLAGRLHTDFGGEPRFDNPRAVQIRLRAFDLSGLEEVGRRVRDLYAEQSAAPERIRAHADDAYITLLARTVTGELGGKAGVAPRLFLKKLVADVLDRIDQFEDWDPRRDYRLTVATAELTAVERSARAEPDDIDLDL